MDEEPVVVYRAATPEDAHLLRELLEEAGIRAWLTNTVLAGGAGVDIAGWATQPQVLVSPQDAAQARAIAMDFDRRTSGPRPVEPSPGESSEPNRWPTCPQCGRARTTTCPSCGATGENFPPADMPPEAEPLESAEVPSELTPPLRLCPTCDEPFVPSFPPRCAWCGHEFQAVPEGAEETSADDGVNARVFAAAAAAVAVLGGVLLYFYVVLQGAGK